jgi:prophage regulatory protein
MPALRLYRSRQVTELTGYTPRHIRRLENSGHFPRRIKLGEGQQGAVAWVADEVDAWLSAGVASRNAA